MRLDRFLWAKAGEVAALRRAVLKPNDKEG